MQKKHFGKARKTGDISIVEILSSLIGFIIILHAFAFIFMTLGIITGGIQAGDTSELSNYYRWWVNLILK